MERRRVDELHPGDLIIRHAQILLVVSVHFYNCRSMHIIVLNNGVPSSYVEYGFVTYWAIRN